MPNFEDTKHYAHHSGVECIQVSHAMPSNLAQAFQYIWRHKQKSDPVDDLIKAEAFIDFEIAKSRGSSFYKDPADKLYTALRSETDDDVVLALRMLFEAKDLAITERELALENVFRRVRRMRMRLQQEGATAPYEEETTD